MNYCDVFISCLDSYSDGTHSLQRIHWWTSDLMTLQWKEIRCCCWTAVWWIQHPDRTWPLSMNASGHDCARTMRALALFTLNLDTMFTLTPVLCVQQASFLVSVYVDKHAEGLSASSENHSALNYIFVCTSHKHLLKSVDTITYTINPKCDKSIWQELFNVVKQIQKTYLMHMQKLFNYSRFTVTSYIFSDSMEVDFTYTT